MEQLLWCTDVALGDKKELQSEDAWRDSAKGREVIVGLLLVKCRAQYPG